METLIIIAGGLIGGGSSFKKNFLSLWIWYINTVFAMLPALSLASTVAIMLDLPFVPAGMRHCIAFLVLFIVFLIVLFKISEQILPKPDEIEKYPVAGGKIAGAFFGFLLGCLYAALGVYLAGSIPALNGVISGRDFKASGAKTLCKIVYRATFQTMPDEKTCLHNLNAQKTVKKKAAQKEKNSVSRKADVKQHKKTQQEIDREMVRKLDEIKKNHSSGTIQEANLQSGDKLRKTKKRKKKRRKHGTGDFSVSRQQSTAMQFSTVGAVYNSDGFSVPAVPGKEDLKKAAKEAGNSVSGYSVAP